MTSDDVIRQEVVVPLGAEAAFRLFAVELSEWWPREYTWSGKALVSIGLEPRDGGRCTEIGPHRFECDWGRVLVWRPPTQLVLAWQIGPHREPQPDPENASTIEIQFDPGGATATRVVLQHGNLQRHGEGASDYRQALASDLGWPFILDRFAEAARS